MKNCGKFKSATDKTAVSNGLLYTHKIIWTTAESIASPYHNYDQKLNIPFRCPAQKVVLEVNCEKKVVWLQMQTSWVTTGIFTIFNFCAVLPFSSKPQPATCCSKVNKRIIEWFTDECHYILFWRFIEMLIVATFVFIILVKMFPCSVDIYFIKKM